jgi:hypothetical protein
VRVLVPEVASPAAAAAVADCQCPEALLLMLLLLGEEEGLHLS